ncbi:MAG: ABC transporter permease [Chitinophagaceae bacterium]
MISNYLKTSARSIRRNKIFSVINILGLSMGIACAVLIFMLIRYHLTTDTYHSKVDNIYRVVTNEKNPEGYYSGVPMPLTRAFRTDFPQASKVAMTEAIYNTLVIVPEHAGKELKRFQEDEGIVAVDPQYFDIFDYEWLAGTPQRALEHPSGIILTASKAKKYFGTEAVAGNTLQLNKTVFTVTGVVKDLPANTNFPFDVFFSTSALKAYSERAAEDWDRWGNVHSATNCYVLLPQNTQAAQLEKLLPAFAKKYYPAEDAANFEYKLQPLADLHFNTKYENYKTSVSKPYIWTLALISLFIIITACINFTNLATVQAIRRSREIGVRKVLGSMRKQIFWQFMLEAALIVSVAVVLALAAVQVALPYVAQLMDISLKAGDWRNPTVLLFILGISVLVIFLSGSYPALILSGFKPVLALKNKMTMQKAGGVTLRRGLVVMQFAISQALVICAFVIATQTTYFRKADLGFNKEAIVMLPLPQSQKEQLTVLRNQFNQLPGVQSCSFSRMAPLSGSSAQFNFAFDNVSKDAEFDINGIFADDQYLKTYGLQLVAGTNYISGDSTHRGILVNEELLKRYNMRPQDAIGKLFSLSGNKPEQVIGVVKNFHLFSLQRDIPPCFIAASSKTYRHIGLKISPQNFAATIKQVEKVWASAFPDNLFEYQFLDERIAEFYKDEVRTGTLINIMSCVAIGIGCLGLLGLISFITQQKTKEVGIRKVLGASVSNIVMLFSKEFVILIVIAFALAAPVAWWAMHKWLQDFAYRVSVGWGVFALAIVTAIMITLITISFQSFRAARVNPVKSLKSE